VQIVLALLETMVYYEVIPAAQTNRRNKMWTNEAAIGKNWSTADRATLTTFSDCARFNLYWNDGGEAYSLEDTKEEAIKQLERLGFKAN